MTCAAVVLLNLYCLVFFDDMPVLGQGKPKTWPMIGEKDAVLQRLEFADQGP